MGFIGVQPASVPLTASDITNDIINADKIADNSISEEHLDATVITGLSALAEAPADTDEFLISDGGVLKRIDAQYVGGSGGLVLTGTGSASSNVSAVTIDNAFSSTYDNYLMIFDITGNGNDDPIMHFRSTSPATITSSNYKYGFNGVNDSASGVSNANTGNSELKFDTSLYNSNQIDPPACWGMFIFNSPNNSQHQTTFTGQYVAYKENGSIQTFSGGGVLTLQTALGGVRFSMSGNSVNTLTARIYGIVNS